MPIEHKAQRPSSRLLAHLNWLLDEALEQTFPASDPVAIDIASIKLSQEPCLGVKVNWKRPSGWAASQAFVSLEGRVFAINRTVYAGTGRFDADNSTLTNGFGTRKRRTPRRVLLPESGSTEIAARIGECAAPSCAHAVIVHSAVAITASGRRTMYFLILALIC